MQSWLLITSITFLSVALPLATSSGEATLNPDNSKKLGPNVKLRLSQLSAAENPVVNILLRCHSQLETEQQLQLEKLGTQIHTIAGDVITATISVRQIPNLAQLSLVVYIELSAPGGRYEE